MPDVSLFGFSTQRLFRTIDVTECGGRRLPVRRPRRPSSALANRGRGALPGQSGMERSVSNSLMRNLNRGAASGLHDHSPTEAEIQRWEDDGGAIAPNRSLSPLNRSKASRSDATVFNCDRCPIIKRNF